MNKHSLMKELFEGWKQSKTPEEIAAMEENIETIIAYDTQKQKKKIVSLFTGVPTNSVYYEEETDTFIAKEESYAIATEEERLLNITDCVVADLSSIILGYEFLEQVFKIPQENWKANAYTDYVFGGQFTREYLLEMIEKTVGMETFVRTLLRKNLVPAYSFLADEIKKDTFYIQKQKEA